MRLTLQRSDPSCDWYTIERLEHDGRVWLDPNEYGASLRMSCRITNACVEGTGAEMLAIADAITKREECSFRRCAVRFDGDSAFFCSPRNSEDEGECTLAEADELAEVIRRELQPILANA